MVMDEMTLDQIALAAESITIARLEFTRAVFLAPLEQLVEQLAGVKVGGREAEIEADRSAKRRTGRRKKAGPKKRTAEERDARIIAMAAMHGIPIVEG